MHKWKFLLKGVPISVPFLGVKIKYYYKTLGGGSSIKLNKFITFAHVSMQLLVII